MLQKNRIFQPYIMACAIALCIPMLSIAQAPAPVDTIKLSNPSFEDIPRAGGSGFPMSIMGWTDCGATKFSSETPPDIHPGSFWEVSTLSQHGATYLGIVVRDDETWESLSQPFSSPLKAGECYAMSVYLCRSERYMSRRSQKVDSLYPFDRPAVLRIFGGKSSCEEGELLAISEPVSDFNWKKYTFKLEPSMDHRFITIQAFYKTPVLFPYNGHLLVDNISSIVRMSCSESDVAKVLEPKVAPPVNQKPTPVTRASTPAKPAPKTTSPVTKVEAPKLLTELERNKLHQGKTIRIENLYFKADSTRFQYESNPVLDEIAEFMKQNQDIIIEIGGHTNTIPDSSYCYELSRARAKSVTDFLVKKGVNRSQLQYMGYGKSKPLIPNDRYNKAWQAKNQRVEIKILSLGK